jgi:hypothetical protein
MALPLLKTTSAQITAFSALNVATLLNVAF